MLKAKIVQILFLQIYQNYAKYTFETFTVDGITIAYQTESRDKLAPKVSPSVYKSYFS
jgi:hypothetical protein